MPKTIKHFNNIWILIILLIASFCIVSCDNTPNVNSLKSIAVTTQPNKNTYFLNDKLDISGLTVTATYANGTKKTVSEYKIETDVLNTVGIVTIIISYTEGKITKTASFDVTVNYPQYTVTFVKNDADATDPSFTTKTVTFNSVYDELPSLTKSNHKYEWFDAPSKGNKIDSSTIVTINSNHDLYARWIKEGTYKIEFDGNGYSSGDVPSDIEALINQKIVILDNIKSLNKTNHSFVGWNTKADGTGDTYLPGAFITSNKEQTIVLYAMWTSTENKNIYPITNLKKKNQDGLIKLNWDNPVNDSIKQIQITITPKDMSFSEVISLDSSINSFEWNNGKHGKTYNFSIVSVDSDNSKSSSTNISSCFYKYSEFALPVIEINIPNDLEITTKSWLTDQGLELAKFNLIDYSDSKKNITSLDLDIKGRGNSSWGMPKKSYSLKPDKKNNFFDIANGKHKNWALIANYSDKSLIRNQLAYELGNTIYNNMDWNPHTKQVNLFINGDYRGIYLLCERIKINESQVNVTDVSKVAVGDFATGGWIVEVNWYMDETYNWFTNQGIRISLKDPDDYENYQLIKNKINAIESVLYDDTIWKDETNGWRKYLDEDSFIDWYLINEIAKNVDAKWATSVYMYYNPNDSKIHMGPLWDFDLGFGNIFRDGCDYYEGFWIKDSGWHKRLFEDDTFVSNLKTRWSEKYSKLLAVTAINGKIDSFSNLISKDAKLNFDIWDILGTYVWPNPTGYESRTTYQSEVEYLRTWLTNRINWLNTAIMQL